MGLTWSYTINVSAYVNIRDSNMQYCFIRSLFWMLSKFILINIFEYRLMLSSFIYFADLDTSEIIYV